MLLSICDLLALTCSRIDIIDSIDWSEAGLRARLQDMSVSSREGSPTGAYLLGHCPLLRTRTICEPAVRVRNRDSIGRRAFKC